MTDELVEIYDDAGTRVGTKDRRSVHREGDWHRCFHCLVISEADTQPTVLLQRRAVGLAEFPDRLDVTVAGHLLAGESVSGAVARETREELGVQFSAGEFVHIAEYPLVVRNDRFWSRELTDIFVVHDDRPPSAFPIDRSEVASLAAVPLGDACSLWLGTRAQIRVTEYGGHSARHTTVGMADFVNEPPEYWPSLARLLLTRYVDDGDSRN